MPKAVLVTYDLGGECLVVYIRVARYVLPRGRAEETYGL